MGGGMKWKAAILDQDSFPLIHANYDMNYNAGTDHALIRPVNTVIFNDGPKLSVYMYTFDFWPMLRDVRPWTDPLLYTTTNPNWNKGCRQVESLLFLFPKLIFIKLCD